jgi:tetratricopeptide (TPR) repeat protein
MVKYFQKVIYLASILLVSASYNSYANNLDNGIDCFQKQDYKKAIDLFNKYSEENPDDPEPHKWLAKCYNELFILDLSLKEIEKIKKLEEKKSYINKKEKIKNESIDIIKEPEIIEYKQDKSQPKIIIINPKKKTSVNDFYLGKRK